MASMEPQPGFELVGLDTVQVSDSGLAVWLFGLLVFAVLGCTNLYCTLTGGEFWKVTLNV